MNDEKGINALERLSCIPQTYYSQCVMRCYGAVGTRLVAEQSISPGVRGVARGTRGPVVTRASVRNVIVLLPQPLRGGACIALTW